MMSKTSMPICLVSWLSYLALFAYLHPLHTAPSRLAKPVIPPMLPARSMPEKKGHDKRDRWARLPKSSPQMTSSKNPNVKTAGLRKASKIFSSEGRILTSSRLTLHFFQLHKDASVWKHKGSGWQPQVSCIWVHPD